MLQALSLPTTTTTTANHSPSPLWLLLILRAAGRKQPASERRGARPWLGGSKTCWAASQCCPAAAKLSRRCSVRLCKLRSHCWRFIRAHPPPLAAHSCSLPPLLNPAAPPKHLLFSPLLPPSRPLSSPHSLYKVALLDLPGRFTTYLIYQPVHSLNRTKQLNNNHNEDCFRPRCPCRLCRCSRCCPCRLLAQLRRRLRDHHRQALQLGQP